MRLRILGEYDQGISYPCLVSIPDVLGNVLYFEVIKCSLEEAEVSVNGLV